MQEEVNNGAAQVVVKVGKLSGRLLKAAVAKVLKAWQEKSDPQKLHRGKQTVKQLAAQNKGMSSIDVDKAGIRSFERVARKYGVDFAPKKGRDGKYYVFFKGKDADALTAAFTEYTQKRVKQHSKPSLLAQLAKFKELSKATIGKEKHTCLRRGAVRRRGRRPYRSVSRAGALFLPAGQRPRQNRPAR